MRYNSKNGNILYCIQNQRVTQYVQCIHYTQMHALDFICEPRHLLISLGKVKKTSTMQMDSDSNPGI